MDTANGRSLTFITGANDTYFFMCAILLESLRRHFPDVPCLVMDLGLTEAQKKYFATGGLLLNMPAGLSKADHPYKLKSSMASFLQNEPLQNEPLQNEPSRMPVWIDCDIIALRPGSGALLELANNLVSQKKDIAIATDEGPNATLEAVCNEYGEPRLRSAISEHQSLKECRSLNAGLVVFANLDAAKEWQSISGALEGDRFCDQNALDIICYRDTDRATILDSRIWNVHARLLKTIKAVDSEVICDGQKPIFVHATSAYQGDLLGGAMPISAKDHGCEAFLKLFAHDHLRSLQEEYLSQFMRTNFEALRDAGVLVKISGVGARRNDPCPCGSGKKFKHCHGVDA